MPPLKGCSAGGRLSVAAFENRQIDESGVVLGWRCTAATMVGGVAHLRTTVHTQQSSGRD